MREKTFRRIAIWVPVAVVLLGFLLVAVIAWAIY